MNPRLRIALTLFAIVGLAAPQIALADDEAQTAQAAMEKHFASDEPAETKSSQQGKGSGPTVEEMLDVFTTDVPDNLSVAARRPQVDLDIKFDFDSADLNADGIEQLDTAGRALNDPRLASRRFMLGGHTDDRGDAKYNRSLSQRRAESAKKYLIDKHDISPERLETAGFGSDHPKMADTSPKARKVNRRVVLEMIE
jgi:outer membrane protein OmpA-like peptidoglycan-associated protein